MNSITAEVPPIIENVALLVMSVILIVFSFLLQKNRLGKKSILVVLSVQFLLFIWYAIWFWRSLSSGAIGQYFSSWNNSFFLTKISQNLTSLTVGWIAGAVVLVLLGFTFLKRKKEEVLDRYDILAIFLGAVIVGWPDVLVFLATIFALSLISMIILVIMRKKSLNDRLVITPFIFPSAIITLWVGPYLLALTHLDKIRF